MMQKMGRGSLTIFSSLTMMLVATFLLALLEASHYIELKRIGEINAASVTESAFAGYLPPLWENYHLLGRAVSGEDSLQLESLENELLELSDTNMYPVRGWSWRHNLLQMDTLDVEMVQCRLITDDDGRVFEAATAGYMRNLLQINAVQQLLNNRNSVDALMNQSPSWEDAVYRAQAAITEAEGGSGDDNILSTFSKDVEKGILELVLKNPDEVSQKAINTGAVVSNRTLAKGNQETEIACDALDLLLMDMYLLRYMSGYDKVYPNRALDYEKEYIIGGKSSDIENLRAVVGRILAIREAANFMYLSSDTEKCEAAQLVAEGIALLLANPELAEVIKWGLIAAWAYAESILDVRALLAGERIATFKTDSQWTSDLSILGELGSSFIKAKSCENGMTYGDYVGILLVAHGVDTLAYRSMDVMEASIRILDEYRQFRMDHLIIDAEFAYSYESGPIFMKKGGYHYYVNKKYSYRKAGV